jgi:hypothetical protein
VNNRQIQNEPFIFWLIGQFLPADETPEENIQPIGNLEFYGMLTAIVIVLIVLKLFFTFID